MRVNLNVPYVEKDDAKKLGARWDRERKTWYVPDGMDVSPFEQWITERENFIYLAVGSQECFRCHNQTQVVAFAIPYNSDIIPEDENGLDHPIPGIPETYDSLMFLPRLGCIPAEIRQYLIDKYNYRPKHSNTTNETMLNNCCQSCGILQGEFFLFSEVDSPFFLMDENDLAKLEFFRIRVPGLIHGTIDRWSSMDIAAYNFAESHHVNLDILIYEEIFI